MRRSTLGFLVLAFMLLPATAHATPPQVIFTDHVDVYDTIADCGLFQVVDHAVADLTGTLYFNQNGDPYRFTLRIQGTDSLFNSTGGRTYSSPNVLTYSEDYHQNRAWETGVAFSVNVPGFGTVFNDVGVLRFDENGITAHGVHDAFDGNLAGLCEAFA